MKTVRIPNSELRTMNYVHASHVKTLKTSRNLNAAIYETKSRSKILVIDHNGTIVGASEFGVYINDNALQTLINTSDAGHQVDNLVAEILMCS